MKKFYAHQFVFLFCIPLVLFLGACNTKPDPTMIFPPDREIDTLALSYDSSSTPLVAVEIAGKVYHFIFDSGAHTTLLDMPIPVKEVISADPFKDVFGDSYPANRVALDTFRVGRTTFSALSRYKQRDIKYDGIIGGNILRRLAWKIDFNERKIYAAKSSKSFGVNTADGIPFVLQSSCPVITLRINNVDIDLMIDTGSDYFTCINSRAFNSMPQLKKMAVFWRGVTSVNKNNLFLAANYVPKMDSTWYVEATLQAGNHTLTNEIIQFTSLPTATVGMDFLMRFDYVILDYPGRKLYLGNKQRKTYDYLSQIALNVNSMGLQLSKDSIPRISRIARMEQVKDLRVNDTVLAINRSSFINGEPSFYRREILRKGPLTRFPAFKLIPSFHEIIIENFNKTLPHAEIKVKRGDSILSVKLRREYRFRSFPDTVWNLTGIPLGFPYIATGAFFEFAPDRLEYMFLPRKPADHVLKKDYQPADFTELTYYY
ncbi:hypothetical protein EDD80_11036 [Anseongella ginsenosidimutans]|uniref:Aspartyl protease n=1 Tax=Anseongella ginsenosidimutans TaxID=496056 RepID=A0A4R3KNZ3_9SPHI|nr:hypothetical protein [Anseongella ginsenosidimutans]QEC52418.1 hypothetical protein FRZ59_08770 [Anseongella ginsenosidimutans]TCS85838.1 hypothetical protein EDD80_11036 [Anseongella ginsenosidimutans]